MTYAVTTFYTFSNLPEQHLPSIKKELTESAKRRDIIGLMLIAPEGCNATLAGPPKKLEEYKTILQDYFGKLRFKDSESDDAPFRRFKIKIKREIVALKRTDIHPSMDSRNHVSPEKWDAMLEQDDTVVIDVRNTYETALGMFKNAIDPNTDTFSSFPEFVKKSDIPKNKNIMMYCMGGIRCEKASIAMQELGYKNVYQLDGGILNYIEKRPNKNYNGECFVFDHRVSVDQHLKPSQTYDRCVACGNPGNQSLTCIRCNREATICADCQRTDRPQACSKNCANIIKRHQHDTPQKS